MKDNLKTATLANGCFWCTEAVFQRFKGVFNVKSGYTGGFIKNPPYREVCTGRTGHAEGIQFQYDETIISFKEILEIFFTTHDPTTLNRQGNDRGTQYRSAIFYESEEQKNEALSIIKYLEDQKVFENPIVTEIAPLSVFYEAEVEHDDYYNRNKEQMYCQYIINPKVAKIKKHYQNKLKEEYV
ncbi:MAG: peptide-methionine (S)-S-oxide reductase MsrA [Leeuwenhoekiella sp.]